MSEQWLLTFIAFLFLGVLPGWSQDQLPTAKSQQINLLFQEAKPLTVQLNFSIKRVKNDSNDSTYLNSFLVHKATENGYDTVPVRIRVRGSFRRTNCYYPPLKIRIAKKDRKGTVFEGNKKLKLVLPCLQEEHKNDYVLKEFLAYKLYEQISPYHFKTRLAHIELQEKKGARLKQHRLRGIFIEDVDAVAERFHGRELKQQVHPLQQDALSAIQNAFFQYLIANTDYSTRVQHNEKLFYLEDKYVCLPYDFDMSGLVNTSYAAVNNIQNMSSSITEVTQRLYKGYKREEALLLQVRQQYLSRKDSMLEATDELRPHFQSRQQFDSARQFILDFFEILEDDKKFYRQIVNKTRVR